MLELRDYQDRIVTKTMDEFIAGAGKPGTAVLINSPCGSGKTIMGLVVCQKILDHAELILGKPAKDVVIGWVATRHNLLEQAEQENELVGCPNIKYISMFDANPPKVDVLVLDEARHEGCTSGANMFQNTDPTIILGLDATPYRSDKIRLCFNKQITDAGIRQLIEIGWLTGYNSYMMDRYDVETVVKTYLADRKKWGKTVIYFHTIEQCEAACAELQRAGVLAEVVTGMTDRSQQIDDFKNNKLEVLVNVYVLSEGFNCSDLNTVFVRDSSKGPTIQMAGRVLRLFPGKEIANVVQSVKTRYPFQRCADPRTQYRQTEDGWVAIGQTNAVRVMSKEMVTRMIANKVTLPAMLLIQKKESRGRGRRRA